MADNSLKRAAEILKSIERHKKEADVQAQRQEKDFIAAVAAKTVDALKPALNAIASQARLTKADMADMVSKIQVETHTPNVVIPDIAVPKAEVVVRSPKINIPDIKMPDEMNVKGFVQLMGVDLDNPLPVQLRTADGSPLDLFKGMTNIINGGGGGGASKIVKISDIRGSTASLIDQIDGALKVTGSFSAALSADTGSGEIGSDTLRTVQATDAIASVNVVDAFGSTSVSSVFNADNRIRVSVETGGSGLTDAELRASSVPVEQVSGSVWSTEVTGGTVDTVTTVTTVTGITNSLAASLVDSSGVQYSGSNPVPVDGSGVTQPVSGTVTVASVTASTTAIIGDKASDEADGDSNPVKIGGVARIANPTAVAAGDRVSATYDDIGRQVFRPLQVRDLLQTAYVTEDEIQEVTLLAGSAGVYHDLVYLMAANESDAAINLDIRQSTGGTVQMSLEVPANGTAGLSLGGATIPQDHADASWTVKNSASDNSNTTYSVTALFSKEV